NVREHNAVSFAVERRQAQGVRATRRAIPEMRCRFTNYRRRFFMLPLLSLHTIAAARGDGLHPILLAGLKRLTAERTEHVGTEATRTLGLRAANKGSCCERGDREIGACRLIIAD